MPSFQASTKIMRRGSMPCRSIAPGLVPAKKISVMRFGEALAGKREERLMKKSEIEERVRASHEKLTGALAGLSEEQATRKGLNPQWSVKDSLAHIAAWELEGARILREIQAGTWKPQRLNTQLIDDFNARAVEERMGRSFAEVREEFGRAHVEMQQVIATLPEEIDEKSPTYKFIEGVTFRHHAHHAAQIEDWKQILGDG